MKNEVENFFNQDAKDYNMDRYDSNIRSFISTRHIVLEELLEKHTSSNDIFVLDAGCGPGYFLKTTIDKGFKSVGIDISEQMLQISKNKIKSINKLEYLKLIKCNVENIPIQPNNFDLVISAGVIEYLKDDKKYIDQLNNVLKNQGRLMIAITNKYSYLSLFDYAFEVFKKNKMMKVFFNFLKKKVLNRGELKNISFKIHKQSPQKFKRLLNESGFEIIQERYFYYFPSIAKNGTIGDLTRNLQILLEKLSNTNFKILGEGCIFVCYKN